MFCICIYVKTIPRHIFNSLPFSPLSKVILFAMYSASKTFEVSNASVTLKNTLLPTFTEGPFYFKSASIFSPNMLQDYRL